MQDEIITKAEILTLLSINAIAMGLNSTRPQYGSNISLDDAALLNDRVSMQNIENMLFKDQYISYTYLTQAVHD